MLELETHNSGGSLVAPVLHEDGMGGRDQGGVGFDGIARPEGNTIHEAVWLHGVLVDGTLVPGCVHGPHIILAEVAIAHKMWI